MAPSRKLHACLHAAIGGGCILGAILIQLRPDAAVHWQLLKEPLLAAGMVVFLLALLRRRPIVARLSTDLCLSLLTIAAALTVLEIGFRLVRFDFRALEAARRRLPPFYRKPMVPTGDAFFRRPGPDRWKGQVIRTCLKVMRLPEASYQDEPVVTVTYDPLGFRNEDVGSSWEVAVAGDSFTELGFLPFEELFTTVLGGLTGWRILNLGVSHTGPLTHLSYLRDYGLSPGTRHVVIVFYEGNDLTDLDREQLALSEFERTGCYDPEEYRRQSSLLHAVAEWAGAHAPPPVPDAVPIDAFWRAPTGEVALTLEDTAPAAADLTPETLQTFERFLSRYAAFARDHGVQAWLAYMPCKIRVLHGRVRLTENGAAALGEWSPTDLPEFIAEHCAQVDVSFVDLTPALRAALEVQRKLPFNPLYDTHLNAFGSEVVGQALARALQPGP